MRALYPAALAVHRYSHRGWEIDITAYQDNEWVSYVYGPGVDGARRGPYTAVNTALSGARHHIDELIAQGPVEEPKRVRNSGSRPKGNRD